MNTETREHVNETKDPYLEDADLSEGQEEQLKVIVKDRIIANLQDAWILRKGRESGEYRDSVLEDTSLTWLLRVMLLSHQLKEAMNDDS